MAGVALTTTSSLRPLVLLRPLARSFLRSTENSRTISPLRGVFSLLIFGFALRYSGLAFRVPTLDVSVVSCALRNPRPTMRSKPPSKLLLKVPTRASWSTLRTTDFIGHTASSIFDAGAWNQLSPNFVKLLSWYDNDWGYSRRIRDLLVYAASQDEKAWL